MLGVSEKDLTSMMHTTFRAMINHHCPDEVLNIETHFFDAKLRCQSCEYDLDLGRDVWLNRSRWSRLTKEYVSKENLEVFVDGAQTILAGEARPGACVSMLFNDPRRYDKKHRWGGCLQSATYRGDASSNPTLTFYSRTSYVGYMGLLDAAIANRIAATIADGFEDVSVADIAFQWHLTSAQLHHFKSLPYIYSQPDLMKKLEGRKLSSHPWLYVRKWYEKVLEAWDKHKDPEAMLADEKYGPFRRIKRRWLEYKGHLSKNIPPSCPVNTLDFSKCE